MRILQLLAQSPGLVANDAVLYELLPQLGHAVSADRLRTELAWLAEQGLAEVNEYAHLHIAALTERGCDVAQGRACVPGVSPAKPK